MLHPGVGTGIDHCSRRERSALIHAGSYGENTFCTAARSLAERARIPCSSFVEKGKGWISQQETLDPAL
jgi:hypothetical protein